MEFDYGTITVIIGLLTTTIAVFALYTEERRGRIVVEAELFVKLDDKFYGPEMTRKRWTAAKKLLENREPNNELDDLFDEYFSTIAYLLERKALNLEMTYKTVEYWLVRYWHAAEEHIKESRKADPRNWVTLEGVVKKIEHERAKRGDPNLDKDELMRFLREEASYEVS